MLKKLSFMLLLITVTSCENYIEYTGATKIVFEGRVANASGNGQAGIFVSTSVIKEANNGFFSFSTHEDEDIITYATTDENGYYRMIFPRPKNQDNIRLFINVQRPGHPFNEAYSNTTITNITQRDLDNYKIDFGTTVVSDSNNSIKLTVTLPPMYNGSQSAVMAQGLVTNNVLYYTVPGDETQLYHGTLPYTQQENANYTYDPVYTFTVAPDQDIIFSYARLGDTVFNQVTIPVGTEDVNYVIE